MYIYFLSLMLGSSLLSTAYDSSTSPSNCRRVGQFNPPVLETNFQADGVSDRGEKRDLSLSISLPLPVESSELVLDNPGAGEKWDVVEDESHDVRKNKTIEELRKSSVSSMKKPVSPFRRVSSPLNKSGRSSPLNRSGRFSIASVFSRKSVDMSADPEAVNLMTSPVTSPINADPRNAPSAPEGEYACKCIPGKHIVVVFHQAITARAIKLSFMELFARDVYMLVLALSCLLGLLFMS